MNKLIDEINLDELFNENDNDVKIINFLYKKAKLTKMEISLFESYVLKYNANYIKMSNDLNASNYITRKQLKLIINKLIKASFKTDLY